MSERIHEHVWTQGDVTIVFQMSNKKSALLMLDPELEQNLSI